MKGRHAGQATTKKRSYAYTLDTFREQVQAQIVILQISPVLGICRHFVRRDGSFCIKIGTSYNCIKDTHKAYQIKAN